MSDLPIVRDGALRVTPLAPPILVGSAAWFAWLPTARSFAYSETSGPNSGARIGTFTARQEERSGRRFWYAYRQRGGVLRKVYLGRSADLTAERLALAPQRMAQAAEKPSPTVGHGNQMGGTGAWPASLIATKLVAPQTGMALIARPAIEARCLEGAAQTCTVITAPAGFGKTTLLMLTCEQLNARGWRIAWLTLEEAEQDPIRCWMYILAALDRAAPGSGALARRMLSSPRPAPITEALTAMINALAAETIPIALVLDDYHRAATPANDQGLTFLVEHAPPALRLLVTTRSMPDLPLARLRAQGRLGSLTANDLRFSADDAARFMRESMRLSLPDDQLARLTERTEGWVAGLQLAALSLRDQSAAPDLIADLSAASSYISEYLIGEALECQSAADQAFLLQTAPLERLCGALCDAVTGRADGAATLVRLTQAQLFLTPLDHSQTWYRYHHLFAEALRGRLQRTAPDALAQSHRRAAEWLRGERLVDEAIPHFFAAQAPDEAATLIEGASDALVLRGELTRLIRWARALPTAVLLAHPHLCVLYAFGLILQGGGETAATLLNALDGAMVVCGEPSDEIQGEIAVARAILSVVAGDFNGGAALARDGVKRLAPANHLLHALALWITNIIGIVGEEDFSDAARVLDESAQECMRVGNVLVAFIAMMAKAAIEIYQGRLHRATQTCREALQLASSTTDQEMPVAVMAHCLLGETHREWNDLATAEREVREALANDMTLISPEFVMDGQITLAMTQAARGRYDDALATFEEIRRQIQAHRLTPLDLMQMEVMRVRVLIMTGRLAEAASWADERQRARQSEPRIASVALLIEVEDLALARVALAQGRPEDLIASLPMLCERATRAGRLRNVLEARMLLARAQWMVGAVAPALRELEASLALAAPEGFLRVFLDEGDGMLDLLGAYVANRPASRERAHALRILHDGGRAVVAPEPSLPAALSPRELEVLHLLAIGRSNQVIANDLVVALSTVKWHVAQVYRKLGVSRRTQAVARARELRLIA